MFQDSGSRQDATAQGQDQWHDAAGENPFIGPRPFLAPPLPGQFFCPRADDVAALCSLLATQRAVILTGNAGVGKSSLLRAALTPALLAGGCTVLDVPLNWPDDQLRAWCREMRRLPPAPRVLLIDPADRLGADAPALRDLLDLLPENPHLRLLFSLRPAPAAALEETLRGCGVTAAHHMLGPLPPVAARAALTACGCAPDAAAHLIAALGADGDAGAVEPALLQIAGRALWPDLADAATLPARVDAALAAYCRCIIDAALARHPGVANVATLETWLTQFLALSGAAPALVHRDARAQAPAALHDTLEDGWLLRTTSRGGSNWVSLLAPRLGEPLRQALADLVAATPLARAAARWADSGRDPRNLLDGAQLPAALEELAAAPARYGPRERDFLAASVQALAAPPTPASRRGAHIAALLVGAGLLLLAIWALAALRTAARDRAALAEQLAAQNSALAERSAAAEQLSLELRAAAEEVAAAAAQRQRNEQLGRALRAGQLAGAALLRREDAPTQALLYAVEALHVQQQAGEPPVPEAVQSLRDLLTTLGGRPFAVGADDIAALALSADGALLAAGDMAGALYLWPTAPAAPGAVTHSVSSAHAGPIWGAVWLPDGRLVSAGADGAVQVWATYDAAGAPALTPVARSGLSTTDLYALDLAPAGDVLAAGDAAGAVYRWRPDAGAAAETVARHASAVNVVRFAPDGGALASGSVDGEVLLQQGDGGAVAVMQHDGAVNALAFSGDGRWLVSAGADGRLLLYDRAAQQATALTPHASAVNSVIFSGDSRWLASGDDDGLVRLWSLADPRTPLPLRGHRNSVRRMAFLETASGPRLITVSYDRTARLWDYLHPETNPVVLRGHDDALTHLALAGSRIATAAYDRIVRVWDADAPFAQPAQVLMAGDPQGELALAPGDAYLVASSLTRPYAELWDARTGQRLYRREGHSGALAALAVSTDGAAFFTGGRDGRIRIWPTAGAEPGPPGPTLDGHAGPVHSLAVAPDGRLLASGGDDTTVRLWEIATGAPRQTFAGHAAAVMGVAFSPDGATLASVDRAGVLLLRDVATGAVEQELSSGGVGFLAVAFRPDGRWVAAAAEDGAIWIWDLAALPLGPTTLRRHSTEVNALAFSPAGDLLASVDADGLLYLWDLMRLSAPPVAVRAHPASVNAVAFAGDGATLYTAGADGAIRRWTAPLGDLVAAACATAGRNLTAAEWSQVFDTAPYRATCPLVGE